MDKTVQDEEEVTSGISPCIRFVPTKGVVRVHEGDDWGEKPGIGLYFDIRVKSDESVETGHDRSINLAKTAEWNLLLYRGLKTPESNLPDSAIGRFHYSKEYDGDGEFIPESCHGWAHIDQPMFDLLSEHALHGRLPTSISVTALGLEYGWAPDGSVKKWDVRKRPAVLIKSIAFGYSTEVQGINENWVEEVAAATPARADDITALSATLSARIDRGERAAKACAWLLAAIALILLFK